jgi:two-component system, NtrC family, response regulator AtoC
VAATNRDLEAEVESGRFRQDLFFRLETFPLEVPPLRARGEDLDLLAAHFIARFAALRDRPVPALSEQALECLRGYDFPGNVRELSNALERATAFCEGREIRPAHLPDRIRNRRAGTAAADAPTSIALVEGEELPSLEMLERRYIRLVLERTGGNKRKAAAVLGIGRRTLYRRLDEGV